jgi:hypothetical protein
MIINMSFIPDIFISYLNKNFSVIKIKYRRLNYTFFIIIKKKTLVFLLNEKYYVFKAIDFNTTLI